MNKYILFFCLLFSACIPPKSFDTNVGVVHKQINTAGAYTFRLCLETDVFNGIEVNVYKECEDKDSDGWNQLTCFIFIDKDKVEYYSLTPKKRGKTRLKNEFGRATMSGWYSVDSLSQVYTLNLTPGKWKQKYMGKNSPVTCTLQMDTTSNIMYMETIKSSKNTLKVVYSPDRVFEKDKSLPYCFEEYVPEQ